MSVSRRYINMRFSDGEVWWVGLGVCRRNSNTYYSFDLYDNATRLQLRAWLSLIHRFHGATIFMTFTIFAFYFSMMAFSFDNFFSLSQQPLGLRILNPKSRPMLTTCTVCKRLPQESHPQKRVVHAAFERTSFHSFKSTARSSHPYYLSPIWWPNTNGFMARTRVDHGKYRLATDERAILKTQTFTGTVRLTVVIPYRLFGRWRLVTDGRAFPETQSLGGSQLPQQ